MKKTTTLLTLTLLSSSSVLQPMVSAETIKNENSHVSHKGGDIKTNKQIEDGHSSISSTEGNSKTASDKNEMTPSVLETPKTNEGEVKTSQEAQSTETIKTPVLNQALVKNIVFSGMFGTSSFTLDSEGVLTFESGIFNNPDTGIPWKEYQNQIKKIVFNGKVIANPNSSGLFANLSQLSEIDNLSNFDTSKVTDMSFMFNQCGKLSSLDLSTFDTSNITDMSYIFAQCRSLSSLDVSHFNTSNVTNMSAMFEGCSSLPSLDVSHFDTSNVTDMSAMFWSCSSLPSLDVSHFDTQKVTDMSTMFFNCSSLPSLDLSTFDTQKVKDMNTMFKDCSSLPSLDVSHFDTSNVTNMSAMFEGCSSLPSLDVSHFDTQKVTDMSTMFSNCTTLVSLDLSTFDTSNVANMFQMLFGDSKLNKLKLGSKFSFIDGSSAALPFINITDQYTGKWQNIGKGTESSPDGENIWTSDELMANYDISKDAGTYVWQLQSIKAADVTAKYIDTEGNKISDDVVKSGNIGDDYTTEKKSISGYSFKEVQGNPTGQFTDKAQTVTYVYTKNLVKAADVTAKYVDTEGNKISDDVVKSGNIGDDYTTEKKSISGYSFKEVQGNPTGQFTDKAQTVTYVYTKNLVKAADVTAKYVDTEGNKISDDVVKSGNIGDDYTTEKKSISGYNFKEVQGNPTGQFTDKPQTVTYVYTNTQINTVVTKPKRDNTQEYKNNTKTKDRIPSDQQGLPETGENGNTFTLVSGLIFLALAIVGSVFRLKKYKKQ